MMSMHCSLRPAILYRWVKRAQIRRNSKIFGLIFVIAACTCLSLLQDRHLSPLRPFLRKLVSQSFCLQVCVARQHLQRFVA